MLSKVLSEAPIKLVCFKIVSSNEFISIAVKKFYFVMKLSFIYFSFMSKTRFSKMLLIHAALVTFVMSTGRRNLLDKFNQKVFMETITIIFILNFSTKSTNTR